MVHSAEWQRSTSRLVVTFDVNQGGGDDAIGELVAFFVEHRVAFAEMQVGKRLEDRVIEELSELIALRCFFPCRLLK